MTDMITIDRHVPEFVADGWTIDLDNFTYKDFYVGEETVTVTINGEEKEQQRYIYDNKANYDAEAKRLAKERATHKERVIAAFTKRGIVYADIEFSGGNDSGGSDGASFYDADHNLVDHTANFHPNYQFVDGKHTQVELTAEQVEDNNFLSIVEAPIYWRWGSFAGDFSVSGTLKYNISDKKECSWCMGSGCPKCNDGMVDNEGYYTLEYEESSYEYHSEEY